MKKSSEQFMQQMKFDRSTPGTHVFISTEPTSHIPTLYIKKEFFLKGVAPKLIAVSVKAVA